MNCVCAFNKSPAAVASVLDHSQYKLVKMGMLHVQVEAEQGADREGQITLDLVTSLCGSILPVDKGLKDDTDGGLSTAYVGANGLNGGVCGGVATSGSEPVRALHTPRTYQTSPLRVVRVFCRSLRSVTIRRRLRLHWKSPA